MQLVVDANVLFAAIISRKGTYDLFMDKFLELFAPAGILTEFERHRGEIFRLSGLEENDFEMFLAILLSRIKLIPFEEYEPHIKEAEKLCAITESPEDVEYLATALKLCLPIWSNDKALKNQQAVHVFSTDELLKMLEDRPG